ncbi:hypothetical protein B0J17DRAFT_619403 [Rhizoctonia solani]|nr:hypothetical protein B0J17DRAFT_619403 [Rhizoctonia solani]
MESFFLYTCPHSWSSGGRVVTPKRHPNPEPPLHSDTPPRKKRTRTNKAHSKYNSEQAHQSYGLVDMPDEIFAEIFSGVQPGDLLSLSVTCKLVRNVLMKKSAVNIWKSAEGNVPHLPAYPWSNMTPPAYATLLFSKSCTVGGLVPNEI